MEGIDEVSFSFGLIKSGVGWVKVLDFKKEVRGGNRRARGTSQLLDLFELCLLCAVDCQDLGG